MNKTIKDLISGAKLYPVWLHQAYHILSTKYKRTIFGTLWIAGNFVFTSLAITLVFGLLFKQDLKVFLPYAMLGNLTGSACLWVLSEAPEIYISNSSIIKNHAYPFTYYSFEAVARNIMLFLHNLIVFYVFMIFNGTLSVPTWTLIPGMLIVIGCMLTWGTVIGMLSARYRDLRYLIPNLAALLYFLTPLYWRVETLGPEHQWVAEVNPLYHLVSIIRSPLLGVPVTQLNWMYSLGMLAAGAVLWLATFTPFRRRIPFWI